MVGDKLTGHFLTTDYSGLLMMMSGLTLHKHLKITLMMTTLIFGGKRNEIRLITF